MDDDERVDAGDEPLPGDELNGGAAAPRDMAARRRTAKKMGVVAVVCIILASALLAYLFTQAPPTETPPGHEGQIGTRAAPFSLPDAEGSVYESSNYINVTPLVLVFMRVEDQASQDLTGVLGPLRFEYSADLAVLSIMTGPSNSASDVSRFAADHHTSWPLLRGGEDVAREYGVREYPTTFVIDENGTIVNRTSGFVQYDTLAADVNRLVAGEPAPQGPDYGPNVGDRAYGFDLKDLEGNDHTLSGQLQGGPVLLEFFFTKCSHCQNLADDGLQDVHANLSAEITLISVSGDPRDTPQDVALFIVDHDAAWLFLLGSTSNMGDYGIQYYPTTFLIDTGGIIRYRHTGADLTQQDIEAELAKL